MTHICNPSAWEAKVRGLEWISGQPGLHSESKASLDYSMRLCLKSCTCIHACTLVSKYFWAWTLIRHNEEHSKAALSPMSLSSHKGWKTKGIQIDSCHIKNKRSANPKNKEIWGSRWHFCDNLEETDTRTEQAKSRQFLRTEGNPARTPYPNLCFSSYHSACTLSPFPPVSS